MPADTIYVGRGSAWGNPFIVMGIDDEYFITSGAGRNSELMTRAQAQQGACDLYRDYITRLSPKVRATLLLALKGKNLACWCPLDQPCHADILLEVANQ